MTVSEAMKNALEFLEALGYKRGGDIHDDLELAIASIPKRVGDKVILVPSDMRD